MSSNSSDLDNRMKRYEPKEQFMGRLPIIARLDGRAFSSFTKKLTRPYDANFGLCMQITAEYLAKKFNATLVHTQSDEITMLFDYTETDPDNMFCGGRPFKMISLLAAAATAKFNQAMRIYLPDYLAYNDITIDLPELDCRVYQLPSKAEATNVFLWRALDCVRNSVQMLAHATYSHNQCNNKSVRDLLTMLDQDGINWADYPDHFREGTYFRRREVTLYRLVDTGINEPATSEEYTRNRVVPVMYHKFSSFSNREQVVFDDAEPTQYTQE